MCQSRGGADGWQPGRLHAWGWGKPRAGSWRPPLWAWKSFRDILYDGEEEKNLGGSKPGLSSASVAHKFCVLGQMASPFWDSIYPRAELNFVESKVDTSWKLSLSRRIQNYDYKIAGLFHVMSFFFLAAFKIPVWRGKDEAKIPVWDNHAYEVQWVTQRREVFLFYILTHYYEPTQKRWGWGGGVRA